MVREDKLTVCDGCGVVLNDNVTLYPRYLEVTNKKAYKIISNDPSHDPLLMNRVKDQEGRDFTEKIAVTGFDHSKLKPGLTIHACNLRCFKEARSRLGEEV